MNPSDSSRKNTEQALIVLVSLFCLVLFLPVVLVCLFFAKLIESSYYGNDDRKWIRSGLFFLIGLLICNGIWRTFLNYVPDLLIFLRIKNEAITNLISLEKTRYMSFVYLILCPCFLYLLKINKKEPSNIYLFFRRKLDFIFLPIKLFQGLFQGLYTFAFSVIAGGADVSKIKTITLVTSLMGLVASLSFFSLAAYSFPGKNNALMISVAYSYWLLYFYFYITGFISKKNNDNSNFIKHNSDGLKIGRLIEPKKMDLNISWRDINHHIHVLGQPGAGKSVLLRNIYFNQITKGQGLIMIDLKADYNVRSDFKSICIQSGREKDLMIIDLSHPDKSYGYNPLMTGNATELKDKIIGAFEWSEPYYKKVSERVLLTVLMGLVWLRDQKNLMPTLGDLLFSISSVQGLSAITEIITDDRIKSSLYDLAAEYSKDFLKDLQSLKTELSLLTQSEFGIIFSKEKCVNIHEAILDKKVILVELNGQTFNESSKKFGRLLLADLRSASGTIVTDVSENDRPEFTVIIDEFADIVSTEDMAKTFVGFLNRCRGSGIGVVIAHQSLGDFKDPTVKTQIIDSTETLFSFVQKDPETCETLAAIVGTKEVFEKTIQVEDGLFGDSATGLGSQKLVHEYIYNPNVFRNLGVGFAVYVAKKPTRHGIVQITMLEFNGYNDSDIGYADNGESSENSLNLRGLSDLKKQNYSKAMKKSTNDDPADI